MNPPALPATPPGANQPPAATSPPGPPAGISARGAIARIGLVLMAFVMVLITMGPLTWSDLPDPLATSWDSHGEVADVEVRGDLRNSAAGLVTVPALALVVVALWPGERTRGSRTVWATATAAMSAVPLLWTGPIVAANHGHSSAFGVSSPDWWTYLVAAALAVAIAGIVSVLAGLDRAPNRPIAFTPPLDVPDTALIAWSGSIVIRSMAVIAAVLFASGIALIISPTHPLRGLPFLLLGVIVSLQAKIAVYVDRRGLTVTYGLWSWPRTIITPDEIRGAAAAELNRWDWRGRTREGRGAWLQGNPVPRSGPGIIVDLTDGGRYAVSVNDAETAAAALNREVARHQSAV